MTKQELSKLKVDITKEALHDFIYRLVNDQEAVMFINKALEPLYKIKEADRTEEDKQRIKRGEDNKKEYTNRIIDADERIANFLTIIDAYEHNKPVTL